MFFNQIFDSFPDTRVQIHMDSLFTYSLHKHYFSRSLSFISLIKKCYSDSTLTRANIQTPTFIREGTPTVNLENFHIQGNNLVSKQKIVLLEQEVEKILKHLWG